MSGQPENGGGVPAAGAGEGFDPGELFRLLAALRHPETGCPWDREQGLTDMSRPLLAEAQELAAALEEDDDAHLLEEAGDLLWNLCTLLRIAEEEGRFRPQEAVERVARKMIGRHPHVFGDARASDAAEAARLYEAAKRGETGRGVG
jgi:uncharacterized protein YabN with tetrapyrrole methylase and pyrophosphatase domain